MGGALTGCTGASTPAAPGAAPWCRSLVTTWTGRASGGSAPPPASNTTASTSCEHCNTTTTTTTTTASSSRIISRYLQHYMRCKIIYTFIFINPEFPQNTATALASSISHHINIVQRYLQYYMLIVFSKHEIVIRL